ncbi:hypothetical protein [Gracilibacillus alcaliphilus]|uniref:hypothetical protein n=1 Tax=Gracilibacillus alcaliphilus TaxID=1401441 RepID=UPI0019585E89|nr:hypothetical protein [Gracilibacillus alcaliphilus]MBM7678527.1 hypothetical protein [Gracilibacillus alcaliphilus]
MPPFHVGSHFSGVIAEAVIAELKNITLVIPIETPKLRKNFFGFILIPSNHDYFIYDIELNTSELTYSNYNRPF